jgi:uncharacterized protein Smg (DUF494 family)
MSWLDEQDLGRESVASGLDDMDEEDLDDIIEAVVVDIEDIKDAIHLLSDLLQNSVTGTLNPKESTAQLEKLKQRFYTVGSLSQSFGTKSVGTSQTG